MRERVAHEVRRQPSRKAAQSRSGKSNEMSPPSGRERSACVSQRNKSSSREEGMMETKVRWKERRKKGRRRRENARLVDERSSDQKESRESRRRDGR